MVAPKLIWRVIKSARQTKKRDLLWEKLHPVTVSGACSKLEQAGAKAQIDSINKEAVIARDRRAWAPSESRLGARLGDNKSTSGAKMCVVQERGRQHTHSSTFSSMKDFHLIRQASQQESERGRGRGREQRKSAFNSKSIKSTPSPKLSWRPL